MTVSYLAATGTPLGFGFTRGIWREIVVQEKTLGALVKNFVNGFFRRALCQAYMWQEPVFLRE